MREEAARSSFHYDQDDDGASNVNLKELLAAGSGEHAALVVPGGGSYSYDALRRSANALAAGLAARGIEPGTRICASFGNGAEIVVAFFGTAFARATFAPLNSAYTEDEFRFYLDDIAPALLLLAPGTVPAARAAAGAAGIALAELALDNDGTPVLDGERLTPAAEPAPRDGDVALFLHTSGTTSRPKGVPLTHANLCASAANIVRWYDLRAGDVSLCIMPLFHVHGLVFSTFAMLAAGATVVVPAKFSASAFWPAVRDFGVTIVSAVPTIYRTLLLRADEDRAPGPGAHGLRFLRSSSAPLPAVEMERLESRFGVPVIEAYSMTEASHQMCANPLHGERRPGSVGVGAFVEVAILDAAGNELAPGDVGEVCIKGPNVTSGYHNNPEANATAFVRGWFRTGDYGTLSADGYVTLVGRLKELINRGGEKISPVEIDDALLSHPGVAEAVAFSVPDEKYGEAVAAALVLRAGTNLESVLAHASGKLAPFKIPTSVFVVETIPRTATGKVQRRIVASELAGREPTRLR
jgi:acyl-CoA synthetase (AMP-forming)/AMP-acid ligase II